MDSILNTAVFWVIKIPISVALVICIFLLNITAGLITDVMEFFAWVITNMMANDIKKIKDDSDSEVTED